MRFSERKGLVEVRKVVQKDSIDSKLKNAIWNALNIFYFQYFRNSDDRTNPILTSLKTRIWIHFLNNKFDELSGHNPDFLLYLKEYYEESKWYEVYDLVEFIIANYTGQGASIQNKKFIEYLNREFEDYLSAYRIVSNVVTEITSDEEIESIQSSLKVRSKYNSVKVHIKRALELISDKKNPDYRNSIKESISAVESLCCIITDNKSASLGEALNEIEKKHQLHPALKKSFSSLYGYTSSANGIRHALMEEDSLGAEDAFFMLVQCSSFVNFLIQKFEN